MGGPVKALLNAIEIEYSGGEWRRPLGTDYENNKGFFRPVWYRYQPSMGATCVALRLRNAQDGTPIEVDGRVWGMRFNEQTDYIEIDVGLSYLSWKSYAKFLRPDQGWLPYQSSYEWPSPPNFGDS